MRHIAHDRWRRWPRSPWVHYCDPDCFVVTRMGKVEGTCTSGYLGNYSGTYTWQCAMCGKAAMCRTTGCRPE